MHDFYIYAVVNKTRFALLLSNKEKFNRNYLQQLVVIFIWKNGIFTQFSLVLLQ